jgi:predicted AlkP superfamily phosphohydrolase/phosphomutase
MLLVAARLWARVILISLDGMGAEAYLRDPAAAELTSLRAFAAKGVRAQGLTAHFPSTTANSHAALYTGAWGDVNGITGNAILLSPRAEHTVFERGNGYRSDGLRAEPLWVAAARQSVPTVAVQVPQAYPFTAASTGGNPSTEREVTVQSGHWSSRFWPRRQRQPGLMKVPPVVVNGYQTRLIAPHTVLRKADVYGEPCRGMSGSGNEAKCFQWMAGPVTLHGRMEPDRGEYRTIAITTGRGAPVVARLAPLETEPPRQRELARHFSDGLWVEAGPESIPAVVYFRLFEMAPDGSDFLIYQSPIQELGVYLPADGKGETVRQLLREAGGFIGNGPGHGLMRGSFLLGRPAWKGGDGTAERRYLEAAELVTRQAIRHSRWFTRRFAPQLFLGYLNFPDEFEHNWKGLSAVDSRYLEFRKWGYAIVNRFVAAHVADVSPDDHLIFVSDHGMAAVTHEVAMHAVFRQARLLEVGSNGQPVPERTKALFLRNCVVLNTADWKAGIVPLRARANLMDQVTRALRSIQDPRTGRIVTRIYATGAEAARFGFGGPNGVDLCFDYLPGYVGNNTSEEPVVRRLAPPIGSHGFDPSRRDMHAIFIGAGPRLPKAETWPQMRAIDVAPLVADLLGIEPPAQARGRSPVFSRGTRP